MLITAPPILDTSLYPPFSTFTSYNGLPSWGPLTDPDDVTVTARLYDYTAIGNTVCVHLYPGALHLPWYRVTACR